MDSTFAEGATGTSPPAPSPLLDIRELTLAGPGGAAILDRVSFDIAPGEVVALVGESRSGKTMAGCAVLRLLPAQVRKTGGTILLAGRDVDDLDARSLREMRGAVDDADEAAVGAYPERTVRGHTSTLAVGSAGRPPAASPPAVSPPPKPWWG